MFKPNTVFIVGAGASAEADLPVGSKLLEDISTLLTYRFEQGMLCKHDQILFDAWRTNSDNDHNVFSEHLKAARKIQKAIPFVRSIDNLLHIHNDNELIKFCGKTAIVRAILNAERKSRLRPIETGNTEPELNRLNNTWFIEFARLLMEGRQINDIENIFDGVSIICFNYDRCIPHYLRYAIQSLYPVTINEAERIVDKLEIYHPYGAVGTLQTNHNPQGVAFGSSVTSERIIEISKGIKTFTEQIEDKQTLRLIKTKITEAQNLVFLGFGFHPQNMDLLTPKDKGDTHRLFATAYRISEGDCQEIEHKIRPLSQLVLQGRNLNIKKDLSCVDLFKHFQMSL